MSKTDSRERVTLLLFETDSKNQDVQSILGNLDVAPDKYAVELIDDYSNNIEKVNKLLSENTKGWSSERLPGFDRAVLRMAITELVRNAQTPVGTVISESVQLCEKYSTPESPRFVNGVLGTIAHKVRGVKLLKSNNNEDNNTSQTDM